MCLVGVCHCGVKHLFPQVQIRATRAGTFTDIRTQCLCSPFGRLCKFMWCFDSKMILRAHAYSWDCSCNFEFRSSPRLVLCSMVLSVDVKQQQVAGFQMLILSPKAIMGKIGAWNQADEIWLFCLRLCWWICKWLGFVGSHSLHLWMMVASRIGRRNISMVLHTMCSLLTVFLNDITPRYHVDSRDPLVQYCWSDWLLLSETPRRIFHSRHSF